MPWKESRAMDERAQFAFNVRSVGMTVVQVINEQNFSRLLANAEPGLVALLKVLLCRLRASNETVSAQSCLMAESRPVAERFDRDGDDEIRPTVN